MGIYKIIKGVFYHFFYLTQFQEFKFAIILKKFFKEANLFMKNFVILSSLIFILFIAGGCGAGVSIGSSDSDSDSEILAKNIRLRIDDVLMSVTWQDNNATRELKKILKDKDLVINTSQYGGFEQVGSLGYSLTTNNSDITTQPGDIMLYNGNQIVIFYGSNSWSYTKLGKLTGKTESELKNILDKSGVTIRLSLKD